MCGVVGVHLLKQVLEPKNSDINLNNNFVYFIESNFDWCVVIEALFIENYKRKNLKLQFKYSPLTTVFIDC